MVFDFFKYKLIAWLTRGKPLYIRFGRIPSNEKSKVYYGEKVIGCEKGVSVYHAFIDVNGNIILGTTLPIKKSTLRTQQYLLEYSNKRCFLVTGNLVGKGSDGEPLIKDVSIIKEIKNYKYGKS